MIFECIEHIKKSLSIRENLNFFSIYNFYLKEIYVNKFNKILPPTGSLGDPVTN